CANVALNNLTNVYCRAEAVGAEAGAIHVPQLAPTKPMNFGGLPLGGFEHGEEVPVVTLDSLNLPRCEVLKIAVEGMERQVLLGARELIAHNRPIMYVENDDQEKSAELIRTIDELDYVMYWHHVHYFSPDNFSGNSENVFGDEVAINMLCVPK